MNTLEEYFAIGNRNPADVAIPGLVGVVEKQGPWPSVPLIGLFENHGDSAFTAYVQASKDNGQTVANAFVGVVHVIDTNAGNVANGDTVTINDQLGNEVVFEFQATEGDETEGNVWVDVGVSTDASGANLAAAIVANTTLQGVTASYSADDDELTITINTFNASTTAYTASVVGDVTNWVMGTTTYTRIGAISFTVNGSTVSSVTVQPKAVVPFVITPISDGTGILYNFLRFEVTEGAVGLLGLAALGPDKMRLVRYERAFEPEV